jgi:hypothetical protein
MFRESLTGPKIEIGHTHTHTHTHTHKERDNMVISEGHFFSFLRRKARGQEGYVTELQHLL